MLYIAPQMITPFQMANIIVQFFPWVPDTGELLNQLAAQQGGAHATELLGFADKEPPKIVSAQYSAALQQHQTHTAEGYRELPGGAPSSTSTQQDQDLQQRLHNLRGDEPSDSHWAGDDAHAQPGMKNDAQLQQHALDVKPQVEPDRSYFGAQLQRHEPDSRAPTSGRNSTHQQLPMPKDELKLEP